MKARNSSEGMAPERLEALGTSRDEERKRREERTPLSGRSSKQDLEAGFDKDVPADSLWAL